MSVLTKVYMGLVALRILFALLGTGYIHPDEYFQNGEVVAGILGLHSWRTWEWDPFFPCRSIVPAWVTTGIPFHIIGTLSRGSQLSPRALFAAQRLFFLCSSFLLDYTIYHLSYEPSRTFALVLLGSSHVLHTYQVRPFSNSIESILVAISLLLLRKLLVNEGSTTPKARNRTLALLAFTAVSGLFTRITFAAFSLPTFLEVLKLSLRQSRFSPCAWAQLIFPSLLVAGLTGLGFVYADTSYFTYPQRTAPFEFTPLNFLRYNILPSNLAEHGLHPRWLHIVVNLPMIATPSLLFYVFWTEWDQAYPRVAMKSKDEVKINLGVQETMQKTLVWVRWSGMTLLSAQPHQEPRFLIPLVAPMVSLVVGNGRILRAGKLFWSTWIALNLALAVLFGVLHQGGVVPSLFRVHDLVYDSVAGVVAQDYRIVYWKTYMPPRHLLAVRQSDVATKAVEVLDMAGAPSDQIIRLFQRPHITSRPLSTLLVAPLYSIGDLEAVRACLAQRDRVFPHLDLDHIGEAVKVGWRDGLSLGIFEVDADCVNDSVLSQ